MTFAIYVFGVLLALGGLIYGGVLLDVPRQWITVGAIVLLGLAILSGAKSTRQKDPSA
ncbi:MAG: hypothetical protein JJE39_05235 [Vicinamibacteria bacterium]|nr:hypothetical protein [Vicinamibacteria bacterium]